MRTIRCKRCGDTGHQAKTCMFAVKGFQRPDIEGWATKRKQQEPTRQIVEYIYALEQRWRELEYAIDCMELARDSINDVLEAA